MLNTEKKIQKIDKNNKIYLKICLKISSGKNIKKIKETCENNY